MNKKALNILNVNTTKIEILIEVHGQINIFQILKLKKEKKNLFFYRMIFCKWNKKQIKYFLDMLNCIMIVIILHPFTFSIQTIMDLMDLEVHGL
jgi:hypothetical protein